MNATTAVAMAALGAGVLIDLPGLRYEVPRAGEPGPMEWDLRWYVPREPEVEALVFDWQRDDGITLPPELLERLRALDTDLQYVPLLLGSDKDEDFSPLIVATEEDLRPDSQWDNDFAKDVPKRNWLTDPPLPRYSTSTPLSPRQWARYYPQEPDGIFVINPSTGESVLAWNLSMMIWDVQCEAFVWTTGGSRWVPVEIDWTNSLSGSVYELALGSV